MKRLLPIIFLSMSISGILAQTYYSVYEITCQDIYSLPHISNTWKDN